MMCRSYGPYIRACYATGRHRGEHVPIASAVWGQSNHLVFGRVSSVAKGKRWNVCRCPRCGSPRSYHDSPAEICRLCRMEDP
jgi:hypothetical protein